jgi:hypothetical protein
LCSARGRAADFWVSGGVGAVADGHLLLGDDEIGSSVSRVDGLDGVGAARTTSGVLVEDDEGAVFGGGSRVDLLCIGGNNRAVNLKLDSTNKISGSDSSGDVGGNPDLDVLVAVGAELEELVGSGSRSSTVAV